MAKTNTVIENFRGNKGFSALELGDLLEFKGKLSDSIQKSSEILKGRSSAEDVMHADFFESAARDPQDSAFIKILKDHVFNDEDSSLHGREKIREAFSELPQDLQNLIKTRMALYSTVIPFSEDQKLQQINTLQFTENLLGTSHGKPSEEDGRIKINLGTSRALRDYMENEVSGAVDQEFTPRLFNNDSKAALDEHVRNLAENAGVEASEVDDLMAYLYSTEDHSALFSDTSEREVMQIKALSEAVVMSNLMNMIVAGHTPSSEYALGKKADADTNWDKPWVSAFTDGRFFGKSVYKTLEQEMDTDGEVHLTLGELFRRREYGDRQYETMVEAANKALKITPEYANDHPDQEISEMDVGKIAIEIMKDRAEKLWCVEHSGEEFDQMKIHGMHYSKTFKIAHPSDLMLAEAGLGAPPELKAEAERLGPDSFRLQFLYPEKFQRYREDRYQEVFGKIPKNIIDDLAEDYKAEGRFKDDKTGVSDINKIYNYVERSTSTPAYFFGVRGRAALGHLSQYHQGEDSYSGYITPSPYEGIYKKSLDPIQRVLEDGGCVAHTQKTGGFYTGTFKDAHDGDGGDTSDRCINTVKGECSVFDMIDADPHQFLIDEDPNNRTVSPEKAEENLENMKLNSP
jgi:hypothetical protein